MKGNFYADMKLAYRQAGLRLYLWKIYLEKLKKIP